jgi:hypothetical protein
MRHLLGRGSSVKVGRVLAAACVVAGVCLAGGQTARATLGGGVASVADNHQRLGGESRVQKLASGERHDLQLPSGIVVHEYLSPAGAVYAVTWSGARAPDLRELLGPYFAQLTRRDSFPRSGHHQMAFTGADLMIRSSGHRGSFTGRAWVPSLVPAGLHLDRALEVSR